MQIKPHLPYVLLMAVNLWILPAVIRDTGTAMVMMLASLPLITLIIAAAHARKAGFVAAFAIATGILFIPRFFYILIKRVGLQPGVCFDRADRWRRWKGHELGKRKQDKRCRWKLSERI